MLEVQLQAIKVLQAEAMKQRRGGPGLLDQPRECGARKVVTCSQQRSLCCERMSVLVRARNPRSRHTTG